LDQCSTTFSKGGGAEGPGALLNTLTHIHGLGAKRPKAKPCLKRMGQRRGSVPKKGKKLVSLTNIPEL
jgi:hypothetical protein